MSKYILVRQQGATSAGWAGHPWASRETQEAQRAPQVLHGPSKFVILRVFASTICTVCALYMFSATRDNDSLVDHTCGSTVKWRTVARSDVKWREVAENNVKLRKSGVKWRELA